MPGSASTYPCQPACPRVHLGQCHGVMNVHIIWPQTKLPLRLKPLTVPFAGAFACQDALIAERTLEGGSPYIMDLEDADIYR